MTASTALLRDQNPVIGEPKSGPKRFWTNREIAVLRANWSTGGIEACLPLLPGRTAHAIYGQALKLALAAPETVKRGIPRHRYTSTEFIDAAIRRAYQGTPQVGDIKRLSQTIIRPRWWIRKRAERLGVCVPRFKEPDWTAPEIELLEKHGTKNLDVIAGILRRAGYKRTPSSISNKLHRLDIDREDPENMSARAVGRLLGIDGHAVARLIEKEGLRAKRAGTARTDVQGGDVWRIKRADLRRFIIANPTAIDIRKVDAVWFIDMLAGAK